MERRTSTTKTPKPGTKRADDGIGMVHSVQAILKKTVEEGYSLVDELDSTNIDEEYEDAGDANAGRDCSEREREAGEKERR
ncbi:MAG: hypothetical protein M1836_001465 [Candelina mexicana]|nr:MAG: hypothetical protein M1836_001465 [Candelina mexicana]